MKTEQEIQIEIIPPHNIQKDLEDIIDHFDFISCYDIEWELRGENKKGKFSDLRVRDLKNQAIQALNFVIEKANIQANEQQKFNKPICHKVGNFLALACWWEAFDEPNVYDDDVQPTKIYRHAELLNLELYYTPFSWSKSR